MKDGKLANYLSDRYNGMYMLLYKNGGVYLLVEHWRYLNPVKEAPKLLLKKRVSKPKNLAPSNSLYVYK